VQESLFELSASGDVIKVANFSRPIGSRLITLSRFYFRALSIFATAYSAHPYDSNTVHFKSNCAQF